MLKNETKWSVGLCLVYCCFRVHCYIYMYIYVYIISNMHDKIPDLQVPLI